MRAPSLLFTVGLICLTAAASAGTAPVVSGTLQARQELYYPQGCLHNGNHAVCSFVLVNQGQLLTLNAGIALWGVQFVDSGHVPHGADSAYFMDQFGSRQAQMVLQHNDRALLTVEFVNVDPAVTYGEFHLATQMVSGIPVNQPVYNAPNAPNGAMLATGAQMSGAPGQVPGGGPGGQPGYPGQPVPGQQPAYPGQQLAYAQPGVAGTAPNPQPCVPQGNGGMANALCNANNKMNNGASQMAQSMQMLGQMGSAFRGMFGQRASVPAPAPVPAPVAAPTQVATAVQTAPGAPAPVAPAQVPPAPHQ